MGSNIVYFSAPCDLRKAGKANIEWESIRPFQPLLGQDAQMTGFAAAARLEEIQVRVLAAPEIYNGALRRDHLEAQVDNRVIAHLRFGSPRLPRLLKGAVNTVVLAEDITIPTQLGRHPFAAGTALPASVGSVLVYDRSTPIPERLGAGTVSWATLPEEFHASNINRDVECGAPEEAWDGLTLQSCAGYGEASWSRWDRPAPCDDPTETLARRTAVLLPWNIGAPGSLVPDLLKKVSNLAGWGRFPLTIVVMPYNELPGSLLALKQLAAACAEPRPEPQNCPAILLARAGSIATSLALVRQCRRVWIDTTDPEWRWTLKRIGACGLPANFISAIPPDIAAAYDPERVAADELVTRQSDGRFGLLFWRTRGMSYRRLQTLAEAVRCEVDVPFGPLPSKPPERAARQSLRDLLRPRGAVARD